MSLCSFGLFGFRIVLIDTLILRLKNIFVNEILELRIDEFRKLRISLNMNLVIGYYLLQKKNCVFHTSSLFEFEVGNDSHVHGSGFGL